MVVFWNIPGAIKAQVDTTNFTHLKANLHWKAPAVLMGAGTLLVFKNPLLDRFKVQEFRMEHYSNFRTHIDDMLPYIPAMSVYAADWMGTHAKTDFKNRSVILIKAEIVMLSLVFPLKKWTHIMRPDGSATNALPSGHTAQAFMAAQFLHHELGQQHLAFSIAGYTVATAVGALRILNNRHWISDVCTGAGIGILSTEIAYATHRYCWGKKKPQLSVIPYIGQQSGLYATYKF